MNLLDQKSYTEFFKEDLYEGFVQHLLSELGANKVIMLIGDAPIMSKKGAHEKLRIHFNRFLSKNPSVEKRFNRERQKSMSLRNIAGGTLAFPIDPQDDSLMIKENVRIAPVIPKSEDKIYRPDKAEKANAKPLTGQVLKGEQHERKYHCPKRLTVHFKEGYATKIGKTTMSFPVNSRSEAMNIILDRFQNKVAYANIQNEEDFVFVRPRNGKKKRNRKLRGKV